jgi:Tfp pilus assembly protein PilF
MSEGHLLRARRSLKGLLAWEPADIEARRDMALIEIETGHFEKAEALVDHSESGCETCTGLTALAEVYYHWGKRWEALDAYRRAVSACEDSPFYFLVKRRLEKCESPIKFGEVNESATWLSKGTAALDRREWEAARAALEHALRFDETNWLALMRLAVVAQRKDRDSAAAHRYLGRAAQLVSCGVLKDQIERA